MYVCINQDVILGKKNEREIVGKMREMKLYNIVRRGTLQLLFRRHIVCNTL